QDGQFYFKLVDAQGTVLLQSKGFASPREAGQAVKRLQTEGAAALPALAGQLQSSDHPALALALDSLHAAAQS
ncbi:MAG: DUF1508 domain-containing protein, partial [Burkholderiales bacterium]|nr:DUF1508 domain-containing protein [Burkholderiales bacterium]